MCKELGKSYGLLAKMTLSYDFTFLAVLKMSLAESMPRFKPCRCSFNPLKKCNKCDKGNEHIAFVSGCAVIMLYHKLRDNISDSGFFGRIPYYLLFPFAKAAYKKSKKKFPEVDGVLVRAMSAQSEVEKANLSDIDAAAHPTAVMLSELAVMLSDDERQKRVLDRLGYTLGRWIYLIDAADDADKDIKTGNYNVFVNAYGLKSSDDIRNMKDKFFETLNFCAVEAAACVPLLDMNGLVPIVENVLTDGLYNVQKLVFDKKKE